MQSLIVPKTKAKIISLKDRTKTMLKNELTLRNPLRMMGYETDEILPEGKIGAVLAPAGVGKTALLVQLAINAMLRNINVLHISLDEPVRKVSLWYKELFGHLATQHQVTHVNQLWDDMASHRFIMTFRVEGFSVPKLEERLTDLSEQGIFSPRMVIMDGLPLGETTKQVLFALKNLTRKQKLSAWLAIHTSSHKSESITGEGMDPLADLMTLLDVVLEIEPQGQTVCIHALKGAPTDSPYPSIFLDPSTMLMKETP
jgi:hypothetical protein